MMVSGSMKSQSAALEMLFVPCISPNQGVPLIDLALLCASRGQNITIIATESIDAIIQNTNPAPPNNLVVAPVQLPRQQANLSNVVDNFSHVKDESTMRKLFVALSLLRTQIEAIIEARQPDCIVADSFYWWATETAALFNIPRITYYPFNAFSLCIKNAVMPDVVDQQLDLHTDLYQPFEINGIPDKLTMTLSQIPDFARVKRGQAVFMDQVKVADMNSYAIILNSFHELDPEYSDYYRKFMGHEIINIGPTDTVMPAEAATNLASASVNDHETLKWLDSKEPNSVLYVCFSSWSTFSDEQIIEIAYALENSGCHFFWNLSNGDSQEKDEIHLPEGVKEKIENRGIIYTQSESPHFLILNHPSVGGFFTHSEWNAIVGGINAGVPMILWSWSYEHFLCEKLATHVLGIGVELGAMDCTYWFDVEKTVIKRDKIEKAVRKLMDGGDQVDEMRRKANEVMKKAKRAVEEGGSSHTNLTLLIENLKKLRDCKANDV